MLNSENHHQHHQYPIADFTTSICNNNNNPTKAIATSSSQHHSKPNGGFDETFSPMSDQQNHDKSQTIFSYNELEAALQQLGISSTSVSSSSVYAHQPVNLMNNTSNSSLNNTTSTNINSSQSSLNSSSRLASVSPLSLSPHSSTSTLNLSSSHSGSPTKTTDHYQQQLHHSYHSLNAFHQNLNLHHQQQQQQHHQSPHQQHQQSSQHHLQHSPSISSRYIIGRGSDSGGNNHSQASSNMQQHQLQQSISSPTSSITSIPSMALSSQQQPHHQQQQSRSFSQQNHHHQHQQQQQQHHHHHHRQHNHQAHMQSDNPSSPTFKVCWCFGEFSGAKGDSQASGDATYHFKILVPAVAAGAIIGKGGETIASLQKDAGARVKMSKSHDFYPGTQERVCLITGSVDGIMTVLDFIMDKIREKPDLTTKLTDIEAKQAQERDKQVKILVPNSTAGMIIGKAGAYIKQVKEESGSYVQISQKPKDITLQERCITIIGEKDNNKIACKMIITKIVEDPQSGACLNVSYADVSGPVANYNPTGSPYATNQNAISSSTASLNSALGTTVGGAGLLVNGTGINLSLNLTAPNPSPNPNIATQLLDHIKVAMRGSGYTETVTTEVCAALGVLAKYGVLGVGVGLPHTNGAHSAPVSYLGVSALEQSAVNAAAAAGGGVFGTLGQVNLEQYIGQQSAAPRQTLEAAAAAQFDPFRHVGSQAATPISINNNNFGLTAATGATAQALGAQTLGALSKSPTPGDLGAKDAKNIEIPEGIVGAILGPSGRSLVEIQHLSGANIQISKKGIFAPGTRNRIVTITGQPSAIATAHYIIDQKINEEETKRARQNTLTTVLQ